MNCLPLFMHGETVSRIFDHLYKIDVYDQYHISTLLFDLVPYQKQNQYKHWYHSRPFLELSDEPSPRLKFQSSLFAYKLNTLLHGTFYTKYPFLQMAL